MSLKKIIKWIGRISLTWIILFLANELFIREWRINYSEKRVQKSIVENYELKSDRFVDLINYLQELNMTSSVEIEFQKGNIINSYLSDVLPPDSVEANATPLSLTTYDYENEETH